MKFRKTLGACLLILLFLSLAGNIGFLNSGTKAVEAFPEYVPIKWALIVLGGFDYYKHPPGSNAIQKAEHWIQSEGVPYDIIEDSNIEVPTDIPTSGKYPLQYANGTIRYGVFVIIMNTYLDASAVNTNHICCAVGNGTNAIVFGMAAKYMPVLLDISPNDVSYIEDYSIYKINCTIHKTFSDGIIEYQQDTNQTIDNPYFLHGNISIAEGKTVWYTLHSNTGKNWIGMMNTTYGSGKVFWSTVIPCHDKFFWYSTFSNHWETKNFKFVAHAINFMFKQARRVDLGLQGYKRWRGAITYRLDEDWPIGITKPPDEALEAGWYVDLVICSLGYLTTGGSLTGGMPDGYAGAPSIKVKHGTWADLVVSTEPLQYASRIFIVYNSTVHGNYDKVKVDWNQNKDFTDDPEFQMWENMTSDITGLMGSYYWGYIDKWENPTKCNLGWLCPLRERMSDFSWWKEMGQEGYIRYGFHSWQHQHLGCPGEVTGGYVYWNSSNFIMNQTWIEQKFTEAKDELAYCLGSTGYGFEADKVLVSHAGNEYKDEVDAALFNLDWVHLTSGDAAKNEPGWFIYTDRKTAMTCGAGGGCPNLPWSFEALKDAVKTLFPIFGIYEHNEGFYNMTFNIYPPDTAYTDMFCFAHLDESFEFWFNSRYMLMNTVNAYCKNNKMILEYKANSTLTDYVWRFPVVHNGKYFNGFSNNRMVGKIKHIDGKYVYIEFSEGGNERLEATYGNNPFIHQTSNYSENMTQVYIPKNLTLQLWNTSGTINIKVNCTRLQQPSSIKLDETPINFKYDPATKICSFNITFNGLKTVELLWEHAPPNPPILVSPALTSRFDPSKSITFNWLFNDPDQGDSQLAYRFQLFNKYDFTSPIIDTGKVVSTSTKTTQILPNSVGLYYWRINTWDNRDVEGEWSGAQPIIVDKLKIILKGVTDDRNNVGTSVSVYFDIARDYDDVLFDQTKGIVYINGSAATWDETNKRWKLNVTQNSVGEWKYQVSSITDTEYHITTINDLTGTQKAIWDKLIVTITPDATTITVGTQVDFTVTAVYAHNNKRAPEFTVNISRDGAHFTSNNFSDACDIASTHQYTTESVAEKTYGLTAFASNSPTVTWSSKTFIQLLVDLITSNALIFIPIILLVVVLAFLLIRERRKRTNT